MIPDEKLSLCPFCGSPAALASYEEGWIIGCTNRGTLEHRGCPLFPSFTYSDNEAEAIAAWNRRSPQASAVEEALERLAQAEDANAKRLLDLADATDSEHKADDLTEKAVLYQQRASYLRGLIPAALRVLPAKPEGWRAMETAPKDGTWILARGHTGDRKPMVPLVVAWCPAGTGKQVASAGPDWFESFSFGRVGDLVEWSPIPTTEEG